VRISSRFNEEIIGKRFGPLGENAVRGLSEIGVPHAQAAHENRHFLRRLTVMPGGTAGADVS
jgi:hypothetical protein